MGTICSLDFCSKYTFHLECFPTHNWVPQLGNNDVYPIRAVMKFPPHWAIMKFIQQLGTKMNEFHKFPHLGENKVSTQLGEKEVYLPNWALMKFIYPIG